MTLIAIGVTVGVILCISIFQFMTNRTLRRLLQLLGAASWTVVVLIHVAETYELFPDMGFGQPNSLGHYLDLTTAILGLILLPLGYAGSRHRS